MKYADAVEHDVEVLKLLKMEDLKDVLAGSLLPFQLKKLEVARALACKPKLLLMDEPAAGMRREELDYLAQVIRKISSMGITIVLVEHRMELVTQVANRVMVMHRGAKLFEGKPKEVLSSKEVIEAYLGEETA